MHISPLLFYLFHSRCQKQGITTRLFFSRGLKTQYVYDIESEGMYKIGNTIYRGHQVQVTTSVLYVVSPSLQSCGCSAIVKKMFMKECCTLSPFCGWTDTKSVSWVTLWAGSAAVVLACVPVAICLWPAALSCWCACHQWLAAGCLWSVAGHGHRHWPLVHCLLWQGSPDAMAFHSHLGQ